MTKRKRRQLLGLFRGTPHKSYRAWELDKPHWENGWWYATDRYVCIRMKGAKAAHRGSEKWPGVDHLPWGKERACDALVSTPARKVRVDGGLRRAVQIGPCWVAATNYERVERLPKVRWALPQKEALSVCFRFAGGEGFALTLDVKDKS